MEMHLRELVQSLKDQFRVEGVIGSNKNDMYKDISTFIRSMAEFKDESDVIFSTMCDKRMEHRLKDILKQIDENAAQQLEHVRAQQEEFENFKAKLEVIEDDIGDL